MGRSPSRSSTDPPIETPDENPATTGGEAYPSQGRLDHLYTQPPPWETGCPQPALAALAEHGAIRGRVLDVGCGTGEHTLMAAGLGCEATGIDLAANALRIAEDKARRRGLKARFLYRDALGLTDLGEVFDTVLDSLHLHALDPARRAAYLRALIAVTRPGSRLFALCYSDVHTGEPVVPHRLSRADLVACFTPETGWTAESIEQTSCPSVRPPGSVTAWLASCTRI